MKNLYLVKVKYYSELDEDSIDDAGIVVATNYTNCLSQILEDYSENEIEALSIIELDGGSNVFEINHVMNMIKEELKNDRVDGNN